MLPFLSKSKPKKKPPRKISREVVPTGVERKLEEDDVIVSKTDTKGKILYGNELFIDISGFREEQLLGAPHSILRHPDMPRCIFKLMWDAIKDGREIFAYAVNLCANGDHYWVFAHISPSYDDQMNIIGYHSMRRMPREEALGKIRPLYKELLTIEQKNSDRRAGLKASMEELEMRLKEKNISYDEFILSV